jgi:hydroxypyruvate isomerase
MKISVCVDILFFRQDFIPALQVIKSAGFDNYEMWTLCDHPHGIGALNKNLTAIAAEADRLGMGCAACVGPFSDLSDAAGHADFLRDFKADIAKAKIIKCPTIIVNMGGAGPATNPEGSIENGIKVLREAGKIAESEGIVLALEPLNSLVDHKNSILAHTDQSFAVIDAVNNPAVKLLYDIYHQQVMDGYVTETIIANLDKIVHLHAAGVPGRQELTPGELDYRFVLQKVAAAGYDQFVGLEYKPAKPVLESLQEMRALTSDIAG